jgi:flotillin
MEVVLVAGGMLFVMLITSFFYATRYKKVAPNQVMIISGSRRPVRDPQTGEQQIVGCRIVNSGGSFVLPIIERVDTLSLEVIQFDFGIDGQFHDGTRARIQGQAQIAIGQDKTAIYQAATRLLNKTESEIADLARQMLDQTVRAHVAQTTATEMRAALQPVAEQIAQAWQSRLEKLGLTCMLFDIVRIN